MKVGGVELEVAHWPGGGTPILLLHEGLGSVTMWRDFPSALAEATGHPVVAWSRPGFGASDPGPADHEPDYMHREADAVPALLDALGLEQAHLFGHSDGASIALIVAERAPERVAGLILEAPHVMVEPVTVAAIAAIGAAYGPELSGRLARYHADPDRMFHRWNRIWLDPRFRNWSIEDLLPAITAPALLIQGLDDEYGTPAQLDRIAASLPDTTRLELASCGHAPHRDQRQAVLEATASFLIEHGSSRLA